MLDFANGKATKRSGALFCCDHWYATTEPKKKEKQLFSGFLVGVITHDNKERACWFTTTQQGRKDDKFVYLSRYTRRKKEAQKLQEALLGNILKGIPVTNNQGLFRSVGNTRTTTYNEESGLITRCKRNTEKVLGLLEGTRCGQKKRTRRVYWYNA